jgi:membrane fusion protein (multidrug efflux system)
MQAPVSIQATAQPAAAPTPAVVLPMPAANAPRSGPPWRLIVIGGTVLLAAAAAGGRLLWHNANFADTDNATVSGHVHPIAARVAGVVVEMNLQDNQRVAAGAPLLRLDTGDAQVQIERLKAQLLQADAAIAGSAAQIAQARAQTAAANAQITQSQAALARAEQDAARSQRLFSAELRAVSRQEVDATTASRDIAAADLTARRAAANAAEQTIASAQAAREAAVAQKAAIAAQLKDAQLQLGYTTLLAPTEGRIGKRTVELGQRVQPGQQLAAIVQGEVWITANFKETQLAKMKAGQAASVHLDAFPGREFTAHVESFAPASGATFALLAPDNATGNFTKIVQRVPVKLVFEPKDIADLAGRIVPGLSATVSVDLRT